MLDALHFPPFNATSSATAVNSINEVLRLLDERDLNINTKNAVLKRFISYILNFYSYTSNSLFLNSYDTMPFLGLQQFYRGLI